MRRIIVISAAAILASAVGAFAQTQTPTPSTPSTPDNRTGNPAVKSPAPNSDKNGAATGTGTGTSGMPAPVSLSSLEKGSNSFTEGQAKSRLESAGFSNVTGLTKDNDGIWRGKASRGGKDVSVGLDFKGNVGTQ